MKAKSQDPEGFQAGDKVRVRAGPNSGLRGIIRTAMDDKVAVELATGDVIQLALEEITNYSLAARRAWEAMPKRSGRPASLAPRKKMVSIRLDSDVWEALGKAVELGLIPSREQAVNEWLKVRLLDLMPPVTD